MDARSNKQEPDGHKSIIEQGDEHSNCTKKDIVKLLMDKCIYLISALIIALHNFQKKHGEAAVIWIGNFWYFAHKMHGIPLRQYDTLMRVVPGVG